MWESVPIRYRGGFDCREILGKMEVAVYTGFTEVHGRRTRDINEKKRKFRLDLGQPFSSRGDLSSGADCPERLPLLLLEIFKIWMDKVVSNLVCPQS